MRVLYLVITLLVANCVTPQQNRSNKEITKDDFFIDIQSSPPGAKIEVDDEYWGPTPLRVQVTRTCEVTYYQFLEPLKICERNVIRAIPNRPGHCTQTKVFTERHNMPKTIYFEMGLCSQPTTIIDQRQ